MRSWTPSYRDFVFFIIGALVIQFLVVKFAVMPTVAPDPNEWRLEALAPPEQLLNFWFFFFYGVALLAVTYIPIERIEKHPSRRQLRTGVAWLFIIVWTVYSIVAISGISIDAKQQCDQSSWVFLCKVFQTSWLKYLALFVSTVAAGVMQAFSVYGATARAQGESWT